MATMRINNIRAVLFDFDDTLIDSSGGRKLAHERVAREIASFSGAHGMNIDADKFLTAIQQIALAMDRTLTYNRNKWWPHLFDRLRLGRIPTEFSLRLTQVYWEAFSQGTRVFKDTLPTLEYLKEKGYCLGLVSDTDGHKGWKKRRVSACGIRPYFDIVVVAGDDTNEVKPNAAPFLLAASKLLIPPGQCVFIGDKPFTDIEGALDAGMKSILVYRRKWDMENRSDLTISSISELQEIL